MSKGSKRGRRSASTREKGLERRKGKRRGRNRVYLGTRVPDRGEPGLDRVSEVRAIVRAIELDYRLGRISKTLALRRLGLLKLAVMRDEDFQSEPKRERALSLIDRALQRLRKRG